MHEWTHFLICELEFFVSAQLSIVVRGHRIKSIQRLFKIKVTRWRFVIERLRIEVVCDLFPCNLPCLIRRTVMLLCVRCGYL